MDHHRPHKGSNGRGRIHPHMRGANDIVLDHQYSVSIYETTSHGGSNGRGRIHPHERNATLKV